MEGRPGRHARLTHILPISGGVDRRLHQSQSRAGFYRALPYPGDQLTEPTHGQGRSAPLLRSWVSPGRGGLSQPTLVGTHSPPPYQTANHRPYTGRRKCHRGCRAGRRIQNRRDGPRRDTTISIPLYDRALIYPRRLPLCQVPAAAVAPNSSGGAAAGPARAAGEERPAAGLSLARAAPTTVRLELLNIQSLLPKLPDITADANINNADILCYTETNLKTHTPNRLVNIPGYTIHRTDRAVGRKKSGGGVAIAVKMPMQVQRLHARTQADQSHLESIWLKVKIDKRRATIIACVYRPPSTSGTQVDRDYDDFEQQIQTAISKQETCSLVITGDFNSDPSTNPAGAARLQDLQKYRLRLLVKKPTFHRNDTHSILDNILISDSDREHHTNVEWDVRDCGYTAHHSKVIMQFQVKRARAKPTYRSGRNWKLLDTNSLLNDLADVDWHVVVRRADTCSDQWEAFSTAVNCVLDRHVPVRRYRVYNPRPPPISEDIRQLMEQRRAAKSTSDSDVYRHLNAEVKRAIRADYRSSVEQRVAEAPPSKMWQQVRPVIASSKTTTTEPENLTADDLNAFFTSVGACTRESVVAEFERSGRAPLHTRLHRVHTDALNLVPITRDELRAVIYTMPNRDTCIEGDIPVSVLKQCFNVTGRVLLQIVNCSIV